MKRPRFIKLDCLMICIVSNCTVQKVLNMIRWNDWSKEMRYFNAIINEIFMDNIYNDFLFSFAYNKTELQKLIENHKIEIIIPKSLMEDIDLSFVSVPIHIDEDS